MRIPVWLTLAVAVLVLGFGSYRMVLAFKKPGQLDKPKTGLYAMSKRSHLVIGSIYLLLGIGLVATSFGWNPFGGSIGPDTQAPAKGSEPSKDKTIPIDQLPPAKK